MPQYDFVITTWFNLPDHARQYIRTTYPQVTEITNLNGCTIKGRITALTQTASETAINNALEDIRSKIVQRTVTEVK